MNKKIRKKHYNPIEEKILKTLYNQKIPLSNYEIAKECKISQPTASSYTKKLGQKNIIKTKPDERTVRHTFNFGLLKTKDTKPNKKGNRKK